jgi:RNA polymerase sigma-70 factor, ECF subfamily
MQTRFAESDVLERRRRAPRRIEAPSDEALISRIACGDPSALRVLVARHQVAIYRFILRIVKDTGLAEDLTSDVFLGVWRRASRFEGRSAVRSWLLAIARNRALSARRRRMDAEELDEEVVSLVPDLGENPEEAVDRKDRSAIIRVCLGALSTKHREAIDLVYYHSQSIGEAARIIGVPESTVKTRVFYARKQLAELLAAAGIDRAVP